MPQIAVVSAAALSACACAASSAPDSSAADYIEMLQQRRRFIADVVAASAGLDALLLPTTQDSAPTIAEVIAADA